VKSLVFRIAQRQYRFSREDAEDVLAQMLEKLWENDGDALRRWRGESPLETYLAVVANRFCLMRIRARKRLRETQTDDADRVPAAASEDPLLGRERWEACRAALARLSERDRQIIEMRYRSDLDYDQIVSRLSFVTAGAARKALHTALERLRVELRRSAPEFFEP
jgi:RNA polymerase sigma factor (sigma-70 family)